MVHTYTFRTYKTLNASTPTEKKVEKKVNVNFDDEAMTFTANIDGVSIDVPAEVETSFMPLEDGGTKQTVPFLTFLAQKQFNIWLSGQVWKQTAATALSTKERTIAFNLMPDGPEKQKVIALLSVLSYLPAKTVKEMDDILRKYLPEQA